MRWESECFFRTYKRVVKDVRLVSRTVPMVVREAEISLLACQLLLGQGALALKVGGKRAGRDELKCSAAEVLREIRRELDAARKPVPRSSFAKRLQQTGRDRRERTGPKMKREPPRRKKHVAPQPPRLKVLSAEQKRQIEDSNLKEAGKYSVNPSPALAFSRSDGYSRPSWTTDQPPCSVSRPCGSQSRNWHPSPLVRHRIPRHRNPFVPPRLSPSAPVRFARG